MFKKRKKRNKIVDWNIDDVVDVHQTHKSKRIKAIAKVLESKGTVNYRQFLAEMQFNGIRKSVAEGYLDVLKELELIKHNKNDIVWKRRRRKYRKVTKQSKQKEETVEKDRCELQEEA